MIFKRSQLVLALLIGVGLQSQILQAQSQVSGVANSNSELEGSNDSFASFRIAPTSLFSAIIPLFTMERNVEPKDFHGSLIDDALSFNLGVEIKPITGLNITAEAWGLQISETPAQAVSTTQGSDWQSSLPKLYIEDSAINEFNIGNHLIGTNLESKGFDLGASYIWDTNRFGQFTLSTKATYVQNFQNSGGLLELSSSEINSINERMISPELQSSLMISWQFGNHTASAITNYIDSFKDISELNLDEINDLVDNITTFDLQYGYTVETGSKDRAIISFGIRNIFDEKTTQVLNSSTRILDQNGRVAYGSIKYQF